MVDPATLAAGAIAKLAFDEFVKTGAGEAAKGAVGGAIELIKALQGKIRAKFHGDKKAETALAQVEQEGSQAALTKLEVYLDDAMAEDAAFADELRQVAQQIINIQNQNTTTLNQQNTNYGRDQNIFNQPTGDIHIGRS
jgi:small-conductance mechanosensitive channel